MEVMNGVVALLVSFIMIAWLLGSSENAVANIIRKTKLLAIGITHMLLSKDKKSKARQDPDAVVVDPNAPTKRIVFLRHGESEWNEVFNRGFGPSFLVRLVSALIREALLLTTRDSVFFDSPLSDTGIKQTQELVRFLQRPQGSVADPKVDEIVAILNGEAAKGSVLTTSNLRRAIATGLIVFWDRLRQTRENFLVLSCLQEVTFNVDGISLLENGEVPDGSVGRALGQEIAFDAEFNAGTKGLRSNGYARMGEFCKWASARPEDTVVCAGHSLWFRDFFRNFLPFAAQHASKQKKIVNCGVVAFTLQQGTLNGRTAYKVDPASITVVYGGFK
eukprot:TRINITY_DN3626_c0_g1_i3.p1 TRINITY_DN3626_c0_g1~~TRINITY_DN3626_c0_g1_i3.p1  ORF type:complete len:333 (-),score=105.50 TRINITY_DN3626_c0_g1_i3:200-1198(-)